ncbi:thiol peroxidase [Salisediminibacterium halotolerans]|uniref:Thiol peroxidase n=1 Tax=Salisediminibacterium halotolerans TaxID=517425 RepID=A0A1H9V6C6_9BACI|nr:MULTISPECIES: thiol peroxidase [Salisediminibacterium]RLJ69367.1 thiol peroxidase (atypical 2-Cys peroxiredoxin) [Actinophytocola xinjiangensis]RPE84007.1 thiol peroxidase (atypical 2-Cys peroxiredoxin) [Salisediminibacterium halotolerans]TWG32442.1 thiol peroxidase (atypical 2-Cys peroxiredoxin) [Salisediminibacterium halotolerans]SES17232.1 thiol peroxidase, atypical 2-Cys peroxiredoxin [Salisediminibacterium haloalkalitolerans]GEL07340.1 putative thiol peroxidase [Salisediminibacterium h
MPSITFKETPVTLMDSPVQTGDTAPDFTVLATDLSEVSLSDFKGKKKLISVVPSIDTGVCDQQTRRFNEEAAQLEDAEVITISVDLPFAQRRWCAAAGIENAHVFSDHRDLDFGKKFGAAIKEMRLLARSIFVVDRNGKVSYTEYVPEVTNHPDYDAAIEAVKAAE